MITVFNAAWLAIFAWVGFRLWSGTTSITARGVSISLLLLLAFSVIGP